MSVFQAQEYPDSPGLRLELGSLPVDGTGYEVCAGWWLVVLCGTGWWVGMCCVVSVVPVVVVVCCGVSCE